MTAKASKNQTLSVLDPKLHACPAARPVVEEGAEPGPPLLFKQCFSGSRATSAPCRTRRTDEHSYTDHQSDSLTNS